MRPQTALRIAEAIQLFHLDGYEYYTYRQLANASGVSQKTISRNKDLIVILDFAINNRGYARCILQA